MMKLKSKILFILCLFSLQNLAMALGGVAARARYKNQKNYVLEASEEYEFKACEKFNKEDDYKYYLKCEQGKIVEVDKLNTLQSDMKAINTKYIRDNFLDHVKEESLHTLNEQKKNIQNTLNCIQNAAKPNCSELNKNLVDNLKQKMSTMREMLAISYAPSFYSFEKKSFFTKKPEHIVGDTEISPLTKTEEKSLQEREKFVKFALEKDWFEKNKNNNCVIKNKNNDEFQIKQNQFCQKQVNNALTKNYETGLDSIKESATKEYHKLVTETPLLTKLNLTGEENDAKILSQVKTELVKINDDLSKSITKVNKLSASDATELIKNKNVVENYLTRNGPMQYLCDIAQEYKDDLFYDELKTDLLIASGALVGGGICGLTAGLGCAVVAAVAFEGASVGLSYYRNDNEELLFNSGLTTSQSLEDRESDYTLSLLVAPLAIGGEFLGQGIKNGAKVMAKAPVKVANHEANTALADFQKTSFLKSSTTKITPPENKAHLISEYLKYDLATPTLNEGWIAAAKANKSAFFVDIENGALKRLNDKLGDKNLVTALTNLHKDILRKNFSEVMAKYNNVKFEMYSDFKSVRFSFLPENMDPKVKELLQKDLKVAFEKTNDEYKTALSRVEGIPADEHADHWFSAGISKTADEAGLAAKNARKMGREPNRIKDFSEVKVIVENQINDISKMQGEIFKLEALKGTPYVQTLGKTNKATLSPDLIDVIRKTPTQPNSLELQALKSDLAEQFGLRLTTENVRDMRNYVENLNALTPGLWNAKREVANLDSAHLGGLSGDVTGMGAMNISQVALDVANSKALHKTTEETLDMLRKGEDTITKEFMKIKNNFALTVHDSLQFKGIAHEVKCSGDDCVVIIKEALSIKDQDDLIRQFAKQDHPSQYRMSFIPDGVEQSLRSKIALHGEMIEKVLRKKIKGVAQGKIDPNKLKNICFGISMPKDLNGGIRLITSHADSVKLTKEEERLIQESFESAILKVNKDLLEEGIETKYIFNKASFI